MDWNFLICCCRKNERQSSIINYKKFCFKQISMRYFFKTSKLISLCILEYKFNYICDWTKQLSGKSFLFSKNREPVEWSNVFGKRKNSWISITIVFKNTLNSQSQIDFYVLVKTIQWYSQKTLTTFYKIKFSINLQIKNTSSWISVAMKNDFDAQ